MRYTRDQAIARIRRFLLARRKGGESTCETAARLGIFCRGYTRWSADQLRVMYPTLTEGLPTEASRDDILHLIVRWDRARMLLHDVATVCDARDLDNQGCLGFDRFSNRELRDLFPQLFERHDQIAGP